MGQGLSSLGRGGRFSERGESADRVQECFHFQESAGLGFHQAGLASLRDCIHFQTSRGLNPITDPKLILSVIRLPSLGLACIHDRPLPVPFPVDSSSCIRSFPLPYPTMDSPTAKHSKTLEVHKEQDQIWCDTAFSCRNDIRQGIFVPAT